MLELEPAYLLHARPYRNTSLLADFFTLRHGRVNGVVRGIRSPASKLRAIVQPFIRLEINWVGKGDLVAIRQIEPAISIGNLNGAGILHGFYLNELLLRLLRVREAHEDLYFAYETALCHLSGANFSEVILRLFEKRLLHSLGYALHLSHEYKRNVPVEPAAWYEFFPDRGPQRVALEARSAECIYPGTSLLALEHEKLTDPSALRDAKRLMRHAIARLLGNRPLKSRELFVK